MIVAAEHAKQKKRIYTNREGKSIEACQVLEPFRVVGKGYDERGEAGDYIIFKGDVEILVKKKIFEANFTGH